MKILNIIESLGRGGAEQALVNLLPSIVKQGHTCEVAVLWPPYSLVESLENSGIVVHCLNMRHRWQVWTGIRKLVSLLDGDNYDIIHAHLSFSGFYAALSKKLTPKAKRIITFHSLDYDSYPANTHWKVFRKKLDAILMRNCMDGLSAVSSAAANHYQAHLELSNISVIPNAFPIGDLVQLSNLSRSEIFARYGLSSDDFVIAMPGRLVHEKGHRFVLQALLLLRAVSLCPKVLIIGRGPLSEQLSDSLNDMQLAGQVTISPEVPHMDLLKVVRCADMILMASTHEGFGLVAGEAMALGKPVLATRVGGLSELIEDGKSGLLVAPGDPAALADGIAKLMAEPEMRERFGQEGRKRIVEAYRTDIVACRWIEYYKLVMGENGKKRRCVE